MKVSVELQDWEDLHDANRKWRTLVTELRRQNREYKAALQYTSETVRILAERVRARNPSDDAGPDVPDA